jgi:thiol-disulfide isomerase/thioredoxin
MSGKDGSLGTSRVVLGQFGNSLEQVRAQAVVKIFWRRVGGLLQQCRLDLCAIGYRVGHMALDKTRYARAHHGGASGWLEGRIFSDRDQGCRGTLRDLTPPSRRMQDMEFRSPGRTTRRKLLGACLACATAISLPEYAQAAHMVRPWPQGKAAPPLNLHDLDGKSWDLAALKGRPVLLNFWASWCEPCRAEMPSLELLATREEHAGLSILSVNYQEPLPTIKRFLESLPFSLPILLDADGQAASVWTPRVFPTTVLIDRSGTPRSSVIGELD